MKRRTLIGISIAFGLLIIAYIVPGFGICHEAVEIDVNSGRMQQRRVFFFICISQTNLETSISKAVGKTVTRPDWRNVSFVPIWPAWLPHLKIIFDSAYGSVPIQLEYLETVWIERSFSDDQKTDSARRLLKAWSDSNNGRAGASYVAELMRQPDNK